MSELPRRKNIRLKNYDYSQNGYYFITICTNNKLHLFGQIVGAIHESPEMAQMRLNANGIIVKSIIENLSVRFPNIYINNYIIMPNHIHMIVVISEEGAIRESPVPRQSLSPQVGAIHESSTPSQSLSPQVGAIHESSAPSRSLLPQVGAIHESPAQKRSLLSQIVGYFKMNTSKQIHVENKNINVWQRNYYDHVIRNDREYQEICGYIDTNPIRWELDKYYTQGDS